jgi:hypothetical protein
MTREAVQLEPGGVSRVDKNHHESGWTGVRAVSFYASGVFLSDLTHTETDLYNKKWLQKL